MRKRICAIAATLLTFANVVPAAAESDVFTSNKRGTSGDFDYEFWRDAGDASMTIKENGTFECVWDKDKTGNVLFRMGKRLGSTETYDEYGDIILEYGAEHKITSGDVSYLCVYGWTEDPLVEFYIVENYGNYKPPGGKGFQGMIEVGDGTYGVYTDTRINMPSIQGNKTFTQYFSVRTDKRTSGTINISEHFKAWEELGLDVSGKMYEVALCVEGYKSSGSANVYSHRLTIGDTVIGAVEEPSTDIAATTEHIDTADSAETEGIVDTTEPVDTTESNAANTDISNVEDKTLINILITIAGVAVLAAGVFIIVNKIRK